MAIVIYRGDDVRLNGVVNDENGEPVDVSEWTIVLSAAPSVGEDPVFQIEATIDEETGTFHFDLNPADHTNLVRSLVYDVQATTDLLKIHTLAMDRIEFIQDITI